MENRELLIFHAEWFNLLKFIPDEDSGIIFKALLSYHLDEEEYNKVSEKLCKSEHY